MFDKRKGNARTKCNCSTLTVRSYHATLRLLKSTRVHDCWANSCRGDDDAVLVVVAVVAVVIVVVIVAIAVIAVVVIVIVTVVTAQPVRHECRHCP